MKRMVGRKLSPTSTTFVLPLIGLQPWVIKWGPKAMVLVGLWLEEVLPGLLLLEVEFLGPEEVLPGPQ
jgi:hypothetical protein